eukprot:TRINITY_DN48918_c0_g1_i1.p1 TRINITY_DN48918_c0_g1~~TRINITY_DN48918_c0_g1_i1.p1  ORF type:complete len:485 (+),score=97.59 TRINITY_DN48918_c0_g1_i1:61-1515(+)
MAFRQSVRRALAFQRTSAIAHSTRSAHKCHIQAGSFASQAQEMKRRPEPASAQELEKWRRGIENAGWLHINAAGASPVSEVAHQALLSFLNREREMGGYGAAAEYKHNKGRDVHDSLAGLLGCDADEIAFTDSAQQAWARAFYSLDFRDGDHILCWSSDYAGNAVAFLQAKKRTPGIKLQVLPMREDGIADVAALKAALEELPSGVRSLVALTHINTDSSIVQPAVEVGALAKAHGAVFLLDTCQSVGQIPVNVRAIGCDFACGTGRKWLRGPRGTGFLYARKGALPSAVPPRGGNPEGQALIGEPAMIDHVSVNWTSQLTYELAPGAQRFEMWESAEASKAALAAAVDFCQEVGPERIIELARALAKELRKRLAEISGITLRDAPPAFNESDAIAAGAGQCAIVTFEAESKLGITADEIKNALAERKIAVTVAPSFHTFDDKSWKRPSVVRLSPTYFNTESEISVVVDAVGEILRTSKRRKVT